jgi:HlyD family secretion protein
MVQPPKTRLKSGIKTDETLTIKTVWVKEGDSIYPVQVKSGMTDEINVEIISGLKEGQKVVVSMEQVKASEAKTETASSPFMPKRPGSAKK